MSSRRGAWALWQPCSCWKVGSASGSVGHTLPCRQQWVAIRSLYREEQHDPSCVYKGLLEIMGIRLGQESTQRQSGPVTKLTYSWMNETMRADEADALEKKGRNTGGAFQVYGGSVRRAGDEMWGWEKALGPGRLWGFTPGSIGTVEMLFSEPRDAGRETIQREITFSVGLPDKMQETKLRLTSK